MDKRQNEARKANKPTTGRRLKGEGRKLRNSAYKTESRRLKNKVRKLLKTFKKQPTNLLVKEALHNLGVKV